MSLSKNAHVTYDVMYQDARYEIIQFERERRCFSLLSMFRYAFRRKFASISAFTKSCVEIVNNRVLILLAILLAIFDNYTG